MRVVFFGTGTSHGIPVVGCSCRVCRSGLPENKRTRASVLVQVERDDPAAGDAAEAANLLIDTATEFRLQAVREGLKGLDAILYTHAHADHLHGLDDIRPLCHTAPIPIYGNRETIEELKERFSYIFRRGQAGGGLPRVGLNVVGDEPFSAAGVRIQPVPLRHGVLKILGYRIGNFAYLTDVSRIPEESYSLLEGLEVLALGALRYRRHPTHFSLEEALGEIEKIRPRRAFLTHFCHDVDHEEIKKELPRGTAPAYDGLAFDVGP